MDFLTVLFEFRNCWNIQKNSQSPPKEIVVPEVAREHTSHAHYVDQLNHEVHHFSWPHRLTNAEGKI
jgi:hypothetical protein